MKLNIAAGGKRYPGWTNIDAAQREGIDIVADMAKIPLADGCADEIMVIHAVEHIYEWEVPGALQEWCRLLCKGGRLILEMPDFLKACKNIAEDYKGNKHPDQQTVWAVMGDGRTKDPLMIHRSVWWFDRLKPLVEAAGFSSVSEHQTIYHPVGRARRDFRLEAIKA